MKIVKGSQSLKDKLNNPALTLGNFDGVHLGHQKILERVKERAREIEGVSVVYTFEPHPLKVLTPRKAPLLITSFEEKVKLLEEMGLDILIREEFTPDFAKLSPREFVENILFKRIGTKEVIVGHDYTFGQEKRGNIKQLEDLGKEFNFRVEVIEAVKHKNLLVGSRIIRELIQQGKVKEVSFLLGRNYSLKGKVMGGKGRGKSILGFPTANLKLQKELLPKRGVYAGKVLYKGSFHSGVINIGFNPTFRNTSLSLEVHLLDFRQNIYQEELELFFVERLREERAFSTPEELAQQIEKDIKRAKSLLGVNQGNEGAVL